MSYFEEHGIKEKAKHKQYANPDISGLFADQSERTELDITIRQFETLLTNQQNPILEFILSQLQENQTEKSTIPASKDIINNLPEIESSGKECNICIEEFKKRAVQLPCKHLFHQQCIVPWLNYNHTCPLCRYELKTDDEEYERRKQKERDVKIRAEDSEEEWDPFFG
jgi:hypothetical protein